jgi:hypothetical protein
METIGAIKALKVKELAHRLKERGLNAVGVKKVLRRRLLEAMASEVLAQTEKSSFTSAAGAKESVEHEHENEDTNQMQESPQKQEEPVPAQDQSPVEYHAVVAAPSSPEYVEHVDAPVEEDPMEMEDDDEEEEEETEALADHKLDDSGLVDLTKDLGSTVVTIAGASAVKTCRTSHGGTPTDKLLLLWPGSSTPSKPGLLFATQKVQSGDGVNIFSKSPVTWSHRKEVPYLRKSSLKENECEGWKRFKSHGRSRSRK